MLDDSSTLPYLIFAAIPRTGSRRDLRDQLSDFENRTDIKLIRYEDRTSASSGKQYFHGKYLVLD